MNIQVYQFKSYPPQTIFAPQWEYYVAGTILTNIDFQKIAKFILKIENKILKKFKPSNYTNKKGIRKTFDGYTGLGPNSLTSRSSDWNLLKYKQDSYEIAKLLDAILDFHDKFLGELQVVPEFYPKELWIQCWANVLRKGEKIGIHMHSVDPDTYLGGFVCVQADTGETSTQTHYVCPANQLNDYNTIDGTCIRDYIHVSDIADIHYQCIKYLNKYSKSNIFNCGYGKGYSVLEIANILKRMKKKTQINFMKKRPGDVGQVKANINKFKKTFKWKPKFNSINKILNSSIKWEKKLNHL